MHFPVTWTPLIWKFSPTMVRQNTDLRENLTNALERDKTLKCIWKYEWMCPWRKPWMTRVRSSHRRCSVRKDVLRNFVKFAGKHLCQSLFFNKVAGLSPATLLKKRPWHRCLPVNFAKILRTPFSKNTSRRLLL